MLRFSSTQEEQLRQRGIQRFVLRLDAMLCRESAATWAARGRDDRTAALQAAVAEGARLGIREEVYLAQFAILYVMTGSRLLQLPGAGRIVESAAMGWREKVYQLIALAGIDLAAGLHPAPVPRAAPMAEGVSA